MFDPRGCLQHQKPAPPFLAEIIQLNREQFFDQVRLIQLRTPRSMGRPSDPMRDYVIHQMFSPAVIGAAQASRTKARSTFIG